MIMNIWGGHDSNSIHDHGTVGSSGIGHLGRILRTPAEFSAVEYPPPVAPQRLHEQVVLDQVAIQVEDDMVGGLVYSPAQPGRYPGLVFIHGTGTKVRTGFARSALTNPLMIYGIWAVVWIIPAGAVMALVNLWSSDTWRGHPVAVAGGCQLPPRRSWQQEKAKPPRTPPRRATR